ncbi:protein MAL2 [Cyclopterus lumpus]|uniref:Mal, T cell differentiation protein 2 n=1 Tax=Cyclopterus lumpus TaxID=8103 RepID=A0A8C2X429_CYCLU|nr:protein MAL2 [Cyclopterus lumpus]
MKGLSGCRSFREVPECSVGFQGVASAPVGPVEGTHDSGGISPAAPFLCLTRRFRWETEGESQRRGGAREKRGGDKEMSQPAADPAVTSFPAPTISLPLGLEVFGTYSGVLVCVEILFGGLVWILVASSNVPVPLLQGWVMFVSLTTFFLSSAYLLVFVTGLADRINTDLNVLDVVYHFIALLFYFAAFVLEAATTAANGGAVKPLLNTTADVLCVTYRRGNIFTLLDDKQYSLNVAATIFAFLVTLCYGGSLVMGFRRWRMSP